MNELIVFDSFDSTNYLESLESNTDLVSFSSIITNKELLSLSNYTIAKSSSILIWMQVASKEESYILDAVLKEYYEEKAQL